jgi:hypothetical protein
MEAQVRLAAALSERRAALGQTPMSVKLDTAIIYCTDPAFAANITTS